jgi:high frequency lysogenization protein
MKYSIEDQTLALAGVFQAARLVQQIARQGQAPGAHMESSLETLFKFDSENVLDVFGGIAGVSLGLKTLQIQLSGNAEQQDLEVTRYAISLLHLEKKLRKHPDLVQRIADGLKTAQNQMDYFSLTHENVFASLAGLYQDTVSTLLPRIIVQGEQHLLSQQANANKIRALLLAGIRSAFLWQQTGGNKLRFLLNRKKYLHAAGQLLARL